jgi:hypothetical protein
MYSHNLVELVKVAELERARLSELTTDPVFARYWRVVIDRHEQGWYRQLGW